MTILTHISFIIFIIFIIFQVTYIFFPLFTIRQSTKVQKIADEKGISILIPAFNEEITIMNCVKGLINVNYSNYEAIIINDGSTDQTFHILHKHLALKVAHKQPANELVHEAIFETFQSTIYPHIFVIEKRNGGKADALNAGIEYASHNIIITLDADSVLDPNALTAMNTAFNNEKVLGAGGMVQIAQGFNGSYIKPAPIFKVAGLIRYQIIQYITDFYLYKTTQAKLGSITVIAGAFGAFRRHALFEVNGFRKTVGEDMDITLRMQQLIKKKYKKHRLIFVPHAICYTECPSTLKDLINQRIRWQKGFIDCIVNFRKKFFIELGIPVSIYLLVDSLFLGTFMAFPTILIPIIIIIKQNIGMALLFLSITSLIGLYRSLASIIIKNRYGHTYKAIDYIRFLLFIPFEVLLYRLLGLLFVTLGTILYIFNKDSWNSVARVGVHNQTYGDSMLVQGKEI